jgi:hypothetical protein
VPLTQTTLFVAFFYYMPPLATNNVLQFHNKITRGQPFFCFFHFSLIWLSRINAHLLQFGLRIVECSPNTAEVVSVCCNFCLNFGREEKVGAKSFLHQESKIVIYLQFQCLLDTLVNRFSFMQPRFCIAFVLNG